MKTRCTFFLCIALIFAAVSCVPVTASPTPIPVTTTIEPTRMFIPELFVAYIDLSGDIWFWKDDASSNRLTSSQNAEEVRLSTDGKWVAYLTTDGEMWAVKTDGSVNQRIVGNDYLNNLIPFGGTTATIDTFRFIPNTHQIFFTVFVAGEVSGIDLFKVNVETGLRERVFSPGQGGNGNYFSPDGDWVVVAYPNELILSRINGQDSRIIFDLPSLRGFSVHRGPDIVWEDDSSGFYVVVPLYDQNENYIGQQQLNFVPVDGDPQDRITFFALPFGEFYISDDGQNVASLMDDGDLINLNIISAGSNVTYISDTDIGFFGWNPDSTRFVIWQKGEITNPLIGSVNEMPQPLTGNPSQVVDSFKWVESNCFLFTTQNILSLHYMIEADTENNPSVLVAADVEPGKYDFTGECALP